MVKTSSHPPPLIWRWMRLLNRRLANRFSTSPREGSPLLLTTTGRVSGLPRQTPLQFEEADGVYYVASARGDQADWYRNLLANPRVMVQIQGRSFPAIAEAIDDPRRIADFFELRLERRPRIMRALLRLEGLPANFTRSDLERFAASKAVVALHPCVEPTDEHDEDQPA